MPKVAKIRVYGEIAPFDPQKSDNLAISLHNVKSQLADFGKYDSVDVHIMSPGGDVDEGYAIRDYFKSLGVPVNTYTDGLCASIATIIQQSACNGGKRFMSDKTESFIHNPWGENTGDAKQMEAYASLLRETEERILNTYVEGSAGKADKDKLRAMMSAQTSITPQQALELGLIDEIIPVKIFAKIGTPQENPNTIISEMNKILNKLKALVTPEVKNVKVTDATGTEYYVEVAEVGKVMYADEAMTTPVAEGTYEVDGNSITVDAAGVILTIEPVMSVEDLKAQLADAQAKIKAFETGEEIATAVEEVLNQAEETIKAKDAEIKALKAGKVTTGKVVARVDGVTKKVGDQPTNKKAEAEARKATYKEVKNPIFNK